MVFLNNRNASLEQTNNKSFTQWATENKPFIQARLIDAGIAFLNEQAEEVPVPVSSLITDNRWHYLHKSSKKQSYRAALDYNSDGIPYLALTYYTFRHGGHSERFDSKAVLKALWQETPAIIGKAIL